MELTSDRQEISLRLLQNGKYVWTITINNPIETANNALLLRKIDSELRDAFPNHVEKSSVKFSELD